MNYPQLIELTVKDSIYGALHKCHSNRILIYNYIFNFMVLFGFILIFGIGLYYCYKQKPSEYELHKKMLKDQQYILSKIRHYQHEKHNQSISNITKLPII